MISKRSKLSLCQYLELHDKPTVCLLLEKHDFGDWHDWMYNNSEKVRILRDLILDASAEKLNNLIIEILKTQNDLCSRISPSYRHDERWQDFLSCLQLDGYKIHDSELVPIEPIIQDVEHQEDDLTNQLAYSNLPSTNEIISMIGSSSKHFRSSPPDFNASLTKARIALETLAKSIARNFQSGGQITYDESKWGSVLSYLKTSSFITEREEQGLAGVYSFISEGAHSPIIKSEDEEMTRLGRNLAICMCYFIIKRFNLLEKQ